MNTYSSTCFSTIKVSIDRILFLYFQILAKSRGLVWQKLQKLGDLQMALGLELDSMIQLVKDTLHTEPYTKTEVCKLLGVDAEELDKVSLTPNTRHIESFKLYQRALHVFQGNYF